MDMFSLQWLPGYQLVRDFVSTVLPDLSTAGITELRYELRRDI